MEIFIGSALSFWVGICFVTYLVFKTGYEANKPDYVRSLEEGVRANNINLPPEEGQKIVTSLISDAEKICHRGLFVTAVSMPLYFFVKLPKYTLPTLMFGVDE